MKAMRALFSRADDALELFFGKVFTWLMEQGISKRVIRWNLWLAFIAAWILTVLSDLKGAKSLYDHIVPIIFGVFMVGIYGFCMYVDDVLDARAEAGEPVPSGRVAALNMKIMGLIFLLGPASVAVIALICWSFAKLTPSLAWKALQGFVCLMLGYLETTPPKKPKKKERTVLVPQEAI